MYGLLREEYSLGSQPSSKAIARHLFTRVHCGKVVIVNRTPASLHASLKKQWFKLSRKVLKEQASTLNTQRIQELCRIASFMQCLKFVSTWPPDEGLADVYIATPEQVLSYPSDCRTMYVTCDMGLEDLHKATAWMDKRSLVVISKLPKSDTV